MSQSSKEASRNILAGLIFGAKPKPPAPPPPLQHAATAPAPSSAATQQPVPMPAASSWALPAQSVDLMEVLTSQPPPRAAAPAPAVPPPYVPPVSTAMGGGASQGPAKVKISLSDLLKMKAPPPPAP
jgi:hypothetical protein